MGWILIIILLIVILVVLWFVFRNNQQSSHESTVVTQASSVSTAADDLKKIEGIGPKISGVLTTAGINTFAQLAKADTAALRTILDEAGIGALADPTTWPEQASLAAAGNTEALKKLQDELKGGRRV